jgi:alpha-tubulin suppressor-like RCC1 family protein
MKFLKKENFLWIVSCLVVLFVLALSLLNLKSSFFQSRETVSRKEIIASGRNTSGQLGMPPGESNFDVNDLQFETQSVQIAASRAHSLVLDNEGSVYSWGGNDAKQLGYATNLLYQSKPKEIPLLNGVKNIASSNNHSLFLKKDGTVWSLGSNFSGQLGTGDNEDRGEAVRVEGLTDVRDIAAGYKFSVVLKDDGSVWGWGASCDTSTKKEAELWWKSMLSNITNIEGGYYDPNSEALVTLDKNEYCINEEVVGILSKVPVKISGLEKVNSISAGYGHILALDEKGNVWSSGCNSYKQLGRVTNAASENATPKMVDGIENGRQVSAGYRHSLVLLEDGTVWGWGQNSHGQLAQENVEDTVIPIKIPIDNVKSIIAGFDFSFVVKNDGTVWGWGRNAGGWFGSSDVEFVNKPTQVAGFDHVTQLAVGGAHILALREE